VLQCHKSLQISATCSIQKQEHSSWQHLFLETKTVRYQENKINVKKNGKKNQQDKNKDSKKRKQYENNK